MSNNKQFKIIHIIPKMNFGGVEIAIQKSYKDLNKIFDYKIVTVKKKGSIDLNQESVISFLLKILFKKIKPDLIITSLWWSHPFGLLLKIFGYKWYAFYHSSASTHYLNKKITNLSAKSCDLCLVDSSETKEFILKKTSKPIKIIPFIFDNYEQLNNTKNRNIDFIFVGRNIKEKRLDILLRFIKKINKLNSNLNFTLIINGQSSNETIEIEKLSYNILNNLSNNEVINYLLKSKFYLHFSDREGMSMSTIEAIQCGCIPVIRLSGELKNYLDNESAIIMDSDNDVCMDKAISMINKIYNDNDNLNKMRSKAFKGIENFEKYTNTFKKIILTKIL